MFNKFKKKSIPEPKFEPESLVYFFTEDNLPTFYQYYDKYKTTPSKANKYSLWKFIFECFNLDINKHYRIDTSNVLRPFIVEIEN